MFFHIFLPSVFLSKPSCGYCPYKPLCLGLNSPFPLSLSPSTLFFCNPPTRTRLTGPGEFVNALPVPGSVLVPVQVLFLLPVLNLNHLFQEDLPERLWPTLIYPLLCVFLELNTLPAFTLVRTICYVHSFDKRLLRVYNHVLGICFVSTVCLALC